MSDTSTDITPNADATGGSTGSEGSCGAALMCCQQLSKTLLKVKSQLEEEKKEPVTEWSVLCNAAGAEMVGQHLSAVAKWGVPPQQSVYQNFGVAASVVEIDVITGKVEILSSDLMYDCGKSLNPAIDIGQAEGAFVMGLGYYLTEKVIINKRNGQVAHNNTWNYKVPLASDVPHHFSVELLQSPFDKGILSSKCSGEPPLCMSTSVFMAVKSAIYAARSEIGLKGFFLLPQPANPSDISIACGTKEAHFTIPDVPLPRM